MFVLTPLTRRPIALVWAGQVLAATGSEFYAVALVWIAAGLVGGDAGYVSAVQAAALLAGSLFGGLVTDRAAPRATMIAADLARVLLLLALASLGPRLGLPVLIGAAACVALATAAFDPALQATVPVLAPDPVLRHATNGLFDMVRRAARILGPSLIALVNRVLPTDRFFLVTAATFLLSAVAVRLGLPRLAAAPAASSPTSTLDTLLGGARALRGQPAMIYGLVTNLIGNAGWAIGPLLGMVLYLRSTRSDPLTDYGLMMTAYGVGNLAANLVLASLGPGRPALRLVACNLIFGAGILMLPLAPSRTALMAIAAFTAINGPFEYLAQVHLMQSVFPPHRLAAAYRLRMCASFTGLLLAYLAAPTLFAWFGLRPVIMAAGALALVNGAIGVALFGGRRLEPRPPAEPATAPDARQPPSPRSSSA